MGPFQPLGKKTRGRYIITTTEYLTRWAEAQRVKDFSMTTNVKFIFEYILSWFGFPKILMSDKCSHFLNKTIVALLEEFQVYHQKVMSYHPQAYGTMEAFNKILENALTNIFNAKSNDWDVLILVILWAYRTTGKKLIRQASFRLVYGQEVVISIKYIMPSLQITVVIDMSDWDSIEEHIAQLVELEEDCFLASFHQQV